MLRPCSSVGGLAKAEEENPLQIESKERSRHYCFIKGVCSDLSLLTRPVGMRGQKGVDCSRWPRRARMSTCPRACLPRRGRGTLRRARSRWV